MSKNEKFRFPAIRYMNCRDGELRWVLFKRVAVVGWVYIILAMLAFSTTACSPGARQASTEVIPTLFPSATPPGLNLEAANRVAHLFLDAWQDGDLQAMYALLTFASQEATPLDSFIAQYEAAQTEISLQGLAYKENALARGETRDVAIFNYDMTFSTETLGVFSDLNRNLYLVVDERSKEWRVAWTPSDIFAEMEGGGKLRVERFGLRRANIYDRNGTILADQLGKVAVVSVVKERITDYPQCIALLDQTTDKSADFIEAKFAESASDWLVEIGTIEPPAYLAFHQQLEAACNAEFKEQYTRRYLNGSLAPHVIGYVGYPTEAELPDLRIAGFNQDSILGRDGIERSWDEALRGTPGGRLVIVTPGGQIVREIVRHESQQSQSVWLTLDADLQKFMIQAFGETYVAAADDWAQGSKGAAGVVLDLHTGEVLAMVSWPTFDANAYTPFPAIGREVAEAMKESNSKDPRRPLLNRATQGLYPAGSVFKTVDTIAVADSGVYTTDHEFNCAPTWQREPNFVRYDWTTTGQGILDLAGAIQHSCNTYFYEAGYQMDQVDPYILPTYARMLGLGSLTGQRDLIEAPGLIGDPDWKRTNTGLNWTVSDAVNMAIGQGFVEVTPLQIGRLFAAYGNGGTLLRPQLVKQVGLIGEALSYEMIPDPMETVEINQEVMDTLIKGMCMVTTERGGTAEHIFRNSPLQTIGVCGKTGTAQSPGEGTAPHAWFAAFAPRENPQIAVAVIVENAGDGSAVAAPIVRRVLEYYFFGITDT